MVVNGMELEEKAGKTMVERPKFVFPLPLIYCKLPSEHGTEHAQASLITCCENM